MTALQIVALVLGSFLIVFLVLAYFGSKHMTEGQWVILRVLSALCAALAASFITGEAVFQMQGTIGDGGSYAITGVAGFALLMIVWFFFPKITGGFPDDYVVAVANGWTFESAARAIAFQDGSAAAFEGFKPEELSTKLKGQQLRARTVGRALASLGSLAQPGAVPPYSVAHDPPIFTLRVG